MKTNRVTGKQLLTLVENDQDKNIPLNVYHNIQQGQSNFKELFSKHYNYLGWSSATRELGKQDFMIT